MPPSPSLPIPSRAIRRRLWFPALPLALSALLLLAPISRAEAFAATAGSSRGPAVSIVDDDGRTIRLERPARKIIALYGAFNEILSSMGLEELLIARTKADTLPPSITDLPTIGTHMRPNLEMVLGLGPDLVLQMGGRREASLPVDALRSQGVPVAVFRADSFEDLFSIIRRLGVLTGAQESAGMLEASLHARLDAVAASLPSEQARPSVFFEVRYPNLLGAGARSMVDDIIHRAGGRNCLDGDKKFIRLGEEELLRLDPQIYLVQRGPMNPDPVAPADRPHFKTLRAVRNGRVYIVDEGAYSRPGPRAVQAVERLAQLLRSGRADSAGTTPPSPKAASASDKDPQ